jgi:hypothetical protein
VLAVVWSTTSHYGLGVPFDMVLRAKRHGGQTEVDLEDLVRINTNRLLFIAKMSGLWIAGFACFFLTMLALRGFVYGNELSQSLILLGFPLSLVGMVSLSTARLIDAEQARGEQLFKRLTRHRIYTQIIGMVSIFVTAMWGMYQNMTLGPLGG